MLHLARKYRAGPCRGSSSRLFYLVRQSTMWPSGNAQPQTRPHWKSEQLLLPWQQAQATHSGSSAAVTLQSHPAELLVSSRLSTTVALCRSTHLGRLHCHVDILEADYRLLPIPVASQFPLLRIKIQCAGQGTNWTDEQEERTPPPSSRQQEPFREIIRFKARKLRGADGIIVA